MPVPNADLFDKQQTQQTNGTPPSNSTEPTETNTQATGSDSYFAAGSGNSIGAQSSEASRALTREEVDRLYEERMEEEYAKRDGGA
ncbi:hypothetical protein N7452_010661 [Penicillium brevicompactum]|uniref:Uncharacterized protein n=1 Tax=Penicillium brevicompactum TaxID=5074 RepID=A0A9W9Q3Y3_PENBR|nr:hypothetical protein N7452_010661 [Penicillium brevicompactum]